MIRRLSVWFAGGAVLLAVLAIAGCAVSTSFVPVKTAKHPGYTAGTACDAPGCHDTYKHKEPYTGPCENCHSLDTWKPAVYSHKDTTFDNGMHPLIGCAMCHTEGEALPTGGCTTCHEAPHAGSKTCTNCHTTNAWGLRKPLPDDHVSLLGGHSKLGCFDCHTAAKTPAKPRQCVDCHGTNHGGLRNCAECHSPKTGWNPKPGWDHDEFFKITGQHTKLDCTDCHKNGRFANTPRVCVGCHGRKHGGLTDCAACHTTAGFKPSTFRHSSVFTLTGAHASLSCTKCHEDRRFASVLGGGSTRCVSCHGVKHGGLRDCSDCHTTSRFVPSTFRHTGFPLVGEHAEVSCSGTAAIPCHVTNTRFVPVPSKRCVSCHGDSSPHGSSATQCQDCHSPSAEAFSPARTHITHPPSSMPLTGSHASSANCGRCHPGLNFSAPTRPCTSSGCHPVFHVGPSDCLRCHFTTRPFVHPPIMVGSAPAPHNYLSFGPFPTGCVKCHPGPGGIPSFVTHTCTNTGCHQS